MDSLVEKINYDFSKENFKIYNIDGKVVRIEKPSGFLKIYKYDPKMNEKETPNEYNRPIKKTR